MNAQAGEVGCIPAWSAEEVADGKGGVTYVLESLRGFDLFL